MAIFGHSAMRKLVSISLLTLFIFASVGGIAGMLFLQYRQKARVEAMIHSDSHHERVTRLHLTKDQCRNLVWEKPDREFRYQGMMYDVIRSKTHPDGSIEYECYRDDKETAITDAITQHLKPDHDSSSDSRNMAVQVFRFFSTLYYQSANDVRPAVHQPPAPSFNYVNLYIPINPASQDQPPEWA